MEYILLGIGILAFVMLYMDLKSTQAEVQALIRRSKKCQCDDILNFPYSTIEGTSLENYITMKEMLVDAKTRGILFLLIKELGYEIQQGSRLVKKVTSKKSR